MTTEETAAADMPVRVLLAGPDTLYFSCDLPLEQLSGRLGRQSVASMRKPRRRILLGDGLDCHPHRLPERLLGASADPAQDGLDLGKRLFDGREVG